MSTRTAPWRLVAQREVMVKLRDKSFILGTLMSLALVAGLMGFQAWQAERHRDVTLVATPEATSMAQAVATPAEADDKLTITVTDAPDADAARAALESGDADGWLHEQDGTWTLTAYDEQDGALSSAVTEGVAQQVLAERAEAAGTTTAELTEGSEVTQTLLKGDAERAGLAQAVGFVMAILFYFSAMMFGMTLAMSVVEEKQSRIVEIIATSMPVTQLLAGKILGNFVLAVGQLALFVGVGLVGLTLTDLGSLLPSLSSGILWYVAFYLAGFVLVATLFAMAGALASRVEDVQSTSTPVTLLIMAVFFSGIFASGTIASVLSWLPPFSAVLMPMRLVTGQAQWWQALVALLLLLALTTLVLAVATRIYRRALLQTSGKLGYKEAWNAEI
ncbi:ABC transporter permease [Janibacter melonis]|uniref:ABC transporter permease n=1 Tax=Janibacter melonis TaxID=262209 RepID=UPI00177C19B3|nr:ABC transporter permease [Janibacter melonis]